MKLYEYEGKSIFRENGIPVPNSVFIDETLSMGPAADLKFPCMVKSQILQGGRGKAGGIKKAADIREAECIAKDLMSRPLKGEKLQGVLLEEMLEVEEEYYLGITVDDISGSPLLIFCKSGGMDIEAVAAESPEKLFRETLTAGEPFTRYQAANICRKAELEGTILTETVAVMTTLYRVFEKMDANLVEINPLVVTKDGKVVAGDAKVVVDDYALYRQPALAQRKVAAVDSDEDKYEKLAREIGYSYVSLGGNIAQISTGAGHGMAILDTIAFYGGKPANFLDMPPSVSEAAMSNVISMVNENEEVTAIVFSFVLSSVSIAYAVNPLISALKKIPSRVPIFGNIVASDVAVADMSLEMAAELVKEYGVELYDDIRDCVKAAVEYGKG